jgi:hypothetical protein
MAERTPSVGTVTLRFLGGFGLVAATLLVGLAGGFGLLGSSGPLTAAVAAYAMLVVVIHTVDARIDGSPWKPHSVVVAVWEYYFAGGMIMYLVRERLWFNYTGDIWTVFWAGVAMTASLWAGVQLVRARGLFGPRALRPRTALPSVPGRLTAFAWLFTALSYVGAVGIYVQSGVIPVLSARVDAARVIVNRTASGFMLPLVMLGIIAVGLHFAAMEVRRSGGAPRRIGSALAGALIALPPLFLYGGRFFVIMPMLLVAIMWIWENRSRLRALATPLVGAAAAGTAMWWVVLRIYGSTATSAQVFRGLMNDTLSEMRLFALSLYQVPREGLAMNILGPVATGLLPERVATLLGIDKAALFRPIGGVVMSSLYQFAGNEFLGIRLSALGEFYLGFGLVGVCALGLVVGGLAILVDGIAEDEDAGRRLVAAVATAALAAIMPYGSVFIITVVTLTAPTVFAVMASRDRREAVGGSLPESRAEVVADAER